MYHSADFFFTLENLRYPHGIAAGLTAPICGQLVTERERPRKAWIYEVFQAYWGWRIWCI